MLQKNVDKTSVGDFRTVLPKMSEPTAYQEIGLPR